jgi:DNA-directed RNA polymerase subunit H
MRFRDLSAEMTLVEKKARVLVKLRGYRIGKREEKKDILSFIVRMPKEKKKALLWCILTKGTVGVAYANQMHKALNEEDIDAGIIVASGRYTQACRKKAKKHWTGECKHLFPWKSDTRECPKCKKAVEAKATEIELIPMIFPAFNIFKHTLVPKHEILTLEEKEELLAKYGIRPYQLPRMRASDPGAIAIGAGPGDIVRIIRESHTAGEYIGYRYVVED